MKWSEKVRLVRVKMQMTQAQLSQATGIPVVTIARWETTDSEPQPKTLGKFLIFCKENHIDFDDIKESL